MSVFLETQRLYVRQFRPSDGEALAEILTDPEVTYFEPYEPFSHDSALQEAVNFSSSNEFYAVALKETDRVNTKNGKLVGHFMPIFKAKALPAKVSALFCMRYFRDCRCGK